MPAPTKPASLTPELLRKQSPDREVLDATADVPWPPASPGGAPSDPAADAPPPRPPRRRRGRARQRTDDAPVIRSLLPARSLRGGRRRRWPRWGAALGLAAILGLAVHTAASRLGPMFAPALDRLAHALPRPPVPANPLERARPEPAAGVGTRPVRGIATARDQEPLAPARPATRLSLATPGGFERRAVAEPVPIAHPAPRETGEADTGRTAALPGEGDGASPLPQEVIPSAGAAGAPGGDGQGRYAVQLAVLRSAERAERGIAALAAQLPDLLSVSDMRVVAGAGRHRIVTRRFADPQAAEALCARIKARNHDCLVVTR